MVDYQKPFPQDDMTILAHCCCLSDAKDWVMVHIMGAPTDEFGEIIDE